jgi:hypothetical protein
MEATGGEMAYEYDRLEREEGGGSFLMGLLAGTVLGAGLGMLFAPKAGSELRRDLSEQTGRLRSTANDAYAQASEKVSQIVDRGRDAYERARTGSPAGKTPGTDYKPGSTDYTSSPNTTGVGTTGGYTSSGTGRV